MDILGPQITVDFSFWIWFFGQPAYVIASGLFAMGAWLFGVQAIFKVAAEKWASYRADKYVANWKYSLLAVDVPPMFVQTPKAVEQIFAHLSGALVSIGVDDKFWFGKKQKGFSLEVISIEGYIQFLIRTEVEFRDLVEASIYAQYPEAEITEVEDYVDNLPEKYPDENYDMMGLEFKLANNQAYPIRTYPDFEYSLSKDAVFSDPMAAILENFTRIGHGENLWMQINIHPVGSSWKEEAIALAKDLMKGGTGKKKTENWLGTFFGNIMQQIFMDIQAALTTREFKTVGAKDPKKDEKVELAPGARKAVDAIETKLTKIGFKTKLRVLYGARKEVFNPSRCLDGFVGAMNQFSLQHLNALVPAQATSAHYDTSRVKTNSLKSDFIKAFRGRKMKWKKSDGYVMNIEELATLWHFPLPFVKTPLLHKAGAKRSEPPSGLPVEMLESPLKPVGSKSEPEEDQKPPEELMYG